MDNIKWGPERECTGGQPCPDWVLVRIVTNHGTLITHRASVVAWRNKFRYKLPAEYEALIAAKEPTHEQMLETLADRYEGMPDELVEIVPAKAAYEQTRGAFEERPHWDQLPMNTRLFLTTLFKAGQEHGKKSLD